MLADSQVLKMVVVVYEVVSESGVNVPAPWGIYIGEKGGHGTQRPQGIVPWKEWNIENNSRLVWEAVALAHTAK